MVNILVVEDEDILRRNLTFILNSAGYSAISARNSADAVEILKSKSFDLVITDLLMPGKGGSEVINYISENSLKTSIIVITAYPSADSAIDAVKKGVFDYFTKPFKTEEILNAIKKILERKKEVPLRWEKLTPLGITGREMSILKLFIEEGITENNEIAEKLSIKITTVKYHLENIYSKFNVKNRTSLISLAIKMLRK